MRAPHILLLLFSTIPLVEIYLLISVGQVIGTIWTVLMVVFTAVLGAALLRSQGLSTLRRGQEPSARGEIPALEMIEGLMLLVGGALLLTPGFVTDANGFICLLTPLRQAVIRYGIRRYGSSMRGQYNQESCCERSSKHWMENTGRKMKTNK